MRLKRKSVIPVFMLILMVLLATVSLWVWLRTAPRKPDPIPPGDYSYAVDYAEYRIHQLMNRHYLPSVAVALIDDQDVIWQDAFGLADLLQLPIDLRELEIEFLVGDESDEDVMIINISDISYEVCPRYPEIKGVPQFWEELIGEYELMARLPSGAVGSEVLCSTSIWVEDGVLQMAGFVGPLLPISESEIIILSGSFAGETMVYKPGTGNIYHQSIVYKPKESTQ
ncbi:MAG: hypothetical protein U9R58_05710 [Chloroflexota bacterium]|nr:hypothetical protein [Chloroflexota bacterium]